MRSVWHSVYFSQSDDEITDELWNILDTQGPEQVVDYLLGAGLHPNESDTTDLDRPWGSSDYTARWGRYVLSWNTSMGYIALQYKIPKGKTARAAAKRVDGYRLGEGK